MEIEVIIGAEKQSKIISKGCTIINLLENMDISSETVVVKKNNQIVIEEELIQEGDTIEIIKVIYGG